MHTVSLFTPPEMAQHRKIELPLIVKRDYANLLIFWKEKRLALQKRAFARSPYNF